MSEDIAEIEATMTKAYLDFNKGQGHRFDTFKAGWEMSASILEAKLKVAVEALEKMDRCFPDCSSYHVNVKCDCNSGIAFAALEKIKAE